MSPITRSPKKPSTSTTPPRYRLVNSIFTKTTNGLNGNNYNNAEVSIEEVRARETSDNMSMAECNNYNNAEVSNEVDTGASNYNISVAEANNFNNAGVSNEEVGTGASNYDSSIAEDMLNYSNQGGHVKSATLHLTFSSTNISPNLLINSSDINQTRHSLGNLSPILPAYNNNTEVSESRSETFLSTIDKSFDPDVPISDLVRIVYNLRNIETNSNRKNLESSFLNKKSKNYVDFFQAHIDDPFNPSMPITDMWNFLRKMRQAPAM